MTDLKITSKLHVSFIKITSKSDLLDPQIFDGTTDRTAISSNGTDGINMTPCTSITIGVQICATDLEHMFGSIGSTHEPLSFETEPCSIKHFLLADHQTASFEM